MGLLGLPLVPDCWLPVNPATGALTVIAPYRFNTVSAQMFTRICPNAFLTPDNVRC